jgi:hypothetical protein
MGGLLRHLQREPIGSLPWVIFDRAAISARCPLSSQSRPDCCIWASDVMGHKATSSSATPSGIAAALWQINHALSQLSHAAEKRFCCYEKARQARSAPGCASNWAFVAGVTGVCRSASQQPVDRRNERHGVAEATLLVACARQTRLCVIAFVSIFVFQL